MANDAFALSPISARAALPSEDDYQAISDAFMETSRGRWFLTEYARRNRNADTAMVLEAVARIEASIATQKQVASETTLAEAAETMRGFIAQASADAAGAVERFNDGHDAAPTQRGLRIIREVAWRLREVGYDSRICDILEAQAEHIDASSAPRPTYALRAAVLDAFDWLGREIDTLAGSGGRADAATTVEAPAPQAAAPAPISKIVQADAPQDEASAPEAPSYEMSAPVIDQPEADVAPQAEALQPDITMASLEVAVDETVVDTAPAPMVEAPALPAESEAPSPADPDLAAALPPEPASHDETALAPARSDEMDVADVAHAAAAAIADPAAAPAPQLAAAPIAEIVPAIAAEVAPTPPPRPAAPEAATMAAGPLSLGESLLARGMVTTPTSKPDPLAPIRRMSQAEKIAFFS